MTAIALVIVLGIAWGMYGGKFGEHGTVSVEARQSVREDCYKLGELRRKDRQKKFSAAERLIYGVLRQGIKKSVYKEGRE